MQHLTFEDLARLVDEPPLPHEAEHVRDCLVCRRELDEMREQTTALARLDDPEPPAAAWHRLEAALLSEGLMQPAVAGRRVGWSAWSEGRPLLRIAAALVLFVLGGATGALLWSHRPGTVTLASNPTRGEPVVVHHPDEARTVASPVEAGFPASAVPAMPAAPGGVRLASTSTGPRPDPVPESVRRAERDLAEAEGAYIAALQRYAAIADPASGADPATRMAALERMISTTRDALERTPDDPVINAYHLAAVRERDALSRQLAGADKDWF